MGDDVKTVITLKVKDLIQGDYLIGSRRTVVRVNRSPAKWGACEVQVTREGHAGPGYWHSWRADTTVTVCRDE